MNSLDSIAIVACCYRMPAAEVMRRVRRLLADEPVPIIGYLVSSLHEHESNLGAGWTALPSDNLDFDFSAYLVGARAVVERGYTGKTVLFINDTLFTDHAAQANFRATWRQRGLVAAIEPPAIAGKADAYTTMCLRNPWSGLGLYITSFCLLVNMRGLALMLLLREFADEDGVTHEHDVDSADWGARLPGAFRQFIKAALVYPNSPYLWYRLRSGSYSSEQLRSKARSIYFEHRLSGAIAAAGCLLPSNAGPRWGSYLALSEWLFRVRRSLVL